MSTRAPRRLATTTRGTRRRPRWIIVAIVGCVLAVALGVSLPLALGGSSPTDDGPRPLTAEQANTLALARFRNYQAGARSIDLRIPTSTGELTISGVVDFRSHVGYGVLHGAGQASSTQGLIQWSPTALIIHRQSTLPATPPATPPPTGWQGRALQSRGSTLDTALRLVLSLAASRPENAQLLQQNGARWVGKTTLHGTTVDIFDGPTRRGPVPSSDTPADRAARVAVRYWVARDGTLHRVRVDIATAPAPTIITFGAKRPRVHTVAGLRGVTD